MSAEHAGSRHLEIGVDGTSRDLLAADGLRLGLVDTADEAAFAAWTEAESRGFHSAAGTTEHVEQRRGYARGRRTTGVWDDSEANPLTPVATTQVWPAELTVPGHRSLPAWAISGVTVAPTHRRRGIARAVIEAELRTAAALDLPLAMLTVSESTIYGRFGFAPSAMACDLTVDTRRARWIGPVAGGRVQFVSPQQLRVGGHEIVERVRLATPGQIAYDGILWDRQLGLMVGDEEAKTLRCVRYDDESGMAQGFAIFRVKENAGDFTNHHLTLLHLVSATADAYAGLWRFLVQMDLVSTITAHLRPPDEPLRWMIADHRAVGVTEFDHLWTRILDVKAALEARTYATPGRIVVAVADPLGAAAGLHTEGAWVLEIDSTGSAVVTAVGEPVDVSMSINELSAIHLGGVSPLVLAQAGRVTGDATTLEAMFRSPVAPWLSIWF